MEANRPRLSQAQKDSLATVCTIGASNLAKIAAAVEGAPITASRKDIRNIMVEYAGAEPGAELAKFVFGLMIGLRQRTATPETRLAAITSRLEQDRGDVRFTGWSACREQIQRLVDSKSVKLAMKAYEVSYDFERLYVGGRFVTSVRPVFDDAREEILAVTVVQTLRLEYVSASGDETSLSLALDKADIEQLMKSCKEALGKAEVAFANARDSWHLPAVTPGGEES